MKLIIAIVQHEDALMLIDGLMEAKFYVTKLSTTGGFLKTGNTTLLIGTEEAKIDQVLEIVRETCHNREQYMATSLPFDSTGVGINSFPIKVNVGGATVFILDVERFEKF
jgi:uncharacterized protein YaaQ